MKPLRFGLIGVGYFGRNYVKLLQSIPDAVLSAVATRTNESLAGIKDAIPKSAVATTNASLVLRNRDVDCVVIATPPSTHLAFVAEALEHGKHVLVEKPMATSLAEAKQLRAIVRKGSSTFMVGHQYVYNDYVRFLKKLIGDGGLGKARYVVGEHMCFPVRKDIGSFWDAAPHQLSLIQFLLSPGKIVEAGGKSIAVSGAKSDAKSGFDDFTAATVRFESGLSATLITTWFGAKKTRLMTVVGDKAVAVFDDVEEKEKLRLFPSQHLPPVTAKEPLRNEVEHFISCIRNGNKPLTGIDSGYEIIEWLDRIARSVKGGKD
ncbi:Gfo/Idh/MocA family oxidoreductase [Candidatus Woesearchaeota archaeon]|nr:Gfo/Idh/MocA family oxidoreductase [Candidatus Woesearchaeota archaeon]